jgi:hypothetical protein
MPPLLLNQPPVRSAHRIKPGSAPASGRTHAPFEQRFGSRWSRSGRDQTGRICVTGSRPVGSTPRAFGRPHGELEARVVDDGDRMRRRTPRRAVVRWGGRARATGSLVT